MAVIDVKRPVLLDNNLNESEILYPTKGSLSLEMTGVSECSLTLPADSPAVAMHAWVKVFNQNGFVGIFRRTSAGQNYPNDRSCVLRHGIDVLQDSIWNEETEFTGTKTQYLTQLLNKQTALINGQRPWTLGSCADQTSFTKKKIKYANLLDLLQEMEDEGGDYYFTYDQTVFPWRLSYVAKSSQVQSEFRLRRNIDKVKISENDSELCTRLILQVNAMTADQSLGVDQNSMVVRVYNNTAAQALYGIIVKTEDIDTNDTLPSGPFTEADAYAQKYLADRAAPLLQIQVDGYELYRITGDTWDESRIGTLCRVALPDYNTFATERVVTVSYPDFIGTPDKVSVSLANTLPKSTKTMNNVQKEVRRLGGGGRGAARESENFVQHFQITDENANILRQAGLYLDANGLLVYADDNENMIGARFNVQADMIGMVVGTNAGGHFIKAGEIALAINATTGESTAYINANHVNISATNTAYTLAGELERDENGRLVIKNASGLYVTRDGSILGVWDKGNLTGSIMVQQINGHSEIKINADRINIDGLLTTIYQEGKTIRAVELAATSQFDSPHIHDEGSVLRFAGSSWGFGTGHSASWKSETIPTFTFSQQHSFVYKLNGVEYTVLGYIIGTHGTKTINFLGE